MEERNQPTKRRVEMQRKWTAEPWEVVKHATSAVIYGAEEEDGSSCTVASDADLEDASRIVACVNALRGMDPEALGELRAAASNMIIEAHSPIADHPDWCEALDRLEAALSKLENPK